MPSQLDPPPGLDDTTRRLWLETVTQLREAGTVFRVDPNSLAAYVSAVRSHQRATALLSQTDIMVIQGARQDDQGNDIPGTGKAVPNPALAIQREAAATIATFARQFRLTASRPAAGPEQPPAPADQPMSQPQAKAPGGKPGTYCEEHRRYECGAEKSRQRGPCHAAAEPDNAAGRCRSHKGGPSARAVALANRLVRAEPTYGTPIKISAEEALVGELWRTAGHVKWLGDRVAELEAQALTWGQDRKVVRYWGEYPGSEIIEQARPHILLELYDRERKHLVHVAAEILRAGLAAQLLRTAQELGTTFGKVVEAILGDMQLTAEQQALVPVVVPRRFRELLAPTGTEEGTP